MNKYICFNKSDDYVYEIDNILCEGQNKILDFFEVKGSFEFKIYVYNTLNEMYKALEKKNIVTNNIAYYLEESNSFYFHVPLEFNKKLYKKNIFHEEVKAIDYLIYGEHPSWLIDGISMYLNNGDIKLALENINERNLSYITVNYMIEKYTKSLFVKLIGLQNFIDFVENNNVFDEAISYYQNIYNIKVKRK